MHLPCLGVFLSVLVCTCLEVQAVYQPQLRNVLKDTSKIWRDGIVVYQIGSLITDVSQQSVIEQSMREIEDDVRTDSGNCVTFQRKEDHDNKDDYLFITLPHDDGLCRTPNVGKEGSKQGLYLTGDCIYKREIMSLLLVALGLYPEHQRPDRDQYIEVHMDNVKNVSVTRPLFEKINSTETDLLHVGLPYDFYSITHFGPHAYAKDPGRPTITTRYPGVSFRNSSILSFYDVLKVQTLYQCTNKGYPMLRDNTKHFYQKSIEIFYPQWRDTSENLPNYMTAKCSKNDSTDVYTLTVQNGATWTSKLPLPPGNFCITIDICIGSSSPDIKSNIQLMGGSYSLNYTQPIGQWEKLNMTYTSDDDWNVVLKGHILWGGDVLALDNLIVRRSVDVPAGCRGY